MHYTLAVIFTADDKKFLEYHEQNYSENEDVFNEFFAKKLDKPLAKFLRDDSGQNGRFDYWGVYQVVTAEKYLGEMEFNQIPHMLLLPDSELLVEAPRYFFSINDENRKEFENWIKKIRETIAKYPIAFIVLVDCHS